ncbi:MAG: YihY/virulence factor BrkB family protein [Anaerolineae bacterium]|nr:YihY/virulence factor BrkB family protein [Anaerolineae bacterium]MBN8619169.1 YihY/virulence factor BrkB family protein [Anaerolineae bacterium]
MLALLQQWWKRQDSSTRELIGYVRQAFANFFHSGTRQAAALAYYAIFSVFPLSLLLAVIVSRLLGPVAAQQQIFNALSLFVPAETAGVLQENIAEAMKQSDSFTILALGGLVWSGLGFFSNITYSLDVIFVVPAQRSLWRQRLVALVMTLILVVLITASFVTSAILRLISASLLGQTSSWLTIGTIFLPLGLNMVIFALLFRYVPAREVHWDAVWPAAIFGAVGWELAKSGFVWYTSTVANVQFIYGGIATAIVLLLWAYLIAAIFLLGAELCAQLNAWFIARNERETLSYIVEIEDLPPNEFD